MPTKQPVILIKLGGSIITEKNRENTLRPEVLNRLINEIARAKKEQNLSIILAHGQGSFAHVPAKKYQIMSGFVQPDSRLGMAITQDSVAQLNRLVVASCLRANLPAVSFYASNTLVTHKQQRYKWFGSVLEEYLHKGLMPVTSGDVIVDTKQGCTAWSAEKVLGQIVEQLAESPDFTVSKVLHVTEVAGVLDDQKKVIPHITPKNYDTVMQLMYEVKGFDVTGGMAHKLQTAMELTNAGIEVSILSGLKTDNLYKALTNQAWIGTRINQDA